MAIEAELADGRILEFPDGTDPSVVQATVKKVLASGQPVRKSTIGSELKRGAQQLASGVQTAYEAVTGSPEEAARAGIERGEAISQVAGEGVGFDPVKKAYQEKGLLSATGEVASQVPRALAGQGANLAVMAGGAKLGSKLGSVAGAPGRIVGGALGAGAALLPQLFGSNVESQAAAQMERGEPVKIDRTKAGVAAAGQAALEGGGAAFTLGKGIVKSVLGIADDAAITSAKAAQQLEATAQRSLAASTGRGVAKGAVVEMPVEVAQQVIERAQAGQDLTSEEALKSYGDAAYQAGLVGGPLGAAGNIVNRGQAKEKLEAKTAADAAAQDAAETISAAPAPLAPSPAQTALPAPEEQAALPAPAERLALPNAPTPESIGEAIQERERLKSRPQTSDIAARVAELDALIDTYNQSDVEVLRDEQAQQKAEAAATAAQDAEVRSRFPGLVSAVEDKAVPPGAFTMQNLVDTGVPMGPGVKSWAQENVVGKTREEVQALIAKDPALVNGKTQRAQLLRELTAPQPTKFEETPSEPTPTKTPAVEQRDEPRASEPSVGVPSEPAAPIVPEPGAGVPGAAETPAAPDGLGLVSAGQPAVPGAEPQKPKPAAVTAEPRDNFAIERKAAYRSGTSEKVEWVVRRKSDGQIIGYYPTRKAAQQTYDIYTLPKDEVFAKYPELRAEAPKSEPKVKPKAETPKSVREKLQAIIDDKGASKRSKQTAFAALDSLDDPAMNETAEDREQNEAYAKKALQSAEQQRKFSIGSSDAAQATSKQEQLQIVKELQGKNVLEAAVWAVSKSPQGYQRMIAMRVAATLRELQSLGVVMGPLTITPDGQFLVSGARGMTNMKVGPNNGPSTIKIILNHPSNGDQSGVGYDVILHELVHAATMGATRIGNKKAAANTRVGKAVSDLYDVSNAVFAHVDAKFKRGETLNKVEQQLRTAYMRDVDEVLAWAMTDRPTQQYMETIPYKGSNLWTQFVEAVRTMLGLSPKADTALSEILRVGDELTSLTATDLKDAAKATGLQFSVAPSTEALIDSMGPLENEEKSMLRKVIDGFKAQGDIDYATKFRTQTADAAATIEHRLHEQFDGAVKDKMGKFNPMGLYRQAQDYSKMLLEYLQVGAISKEPATGLWKVKADPNVRPPVEVYALIDKWAAKNGYSRERGTQIASRILEGVRLDEMRRSNQQDGTKFLIHLTDAEIDQLVREYKADPDLKAMSELMDEARKAMVDNMVAVGRLTKETGDAWKDAIGYVPFDRLEDEKFAAAFSKIKKISNKGLAQVGKLPELVGSKQRPVGNVFDNYLNTLGWMVGQTMKTDGTVRTLRALEDAGHAKFLHRSNQQRPNTVGMYVDGEMMYWELPSKYDVLAFKDLNPPKAKWLQILGQASNVLRKAVTVLPPFALKQVTDDVQRAIMTSGVRNPGALLRMTLSNFGGLALAELRGIQHPTVREFGALGLTGEYDFQQGKPAMSVLKDLGYKPRGKFETLLHRLDGITRASDLAVRKAIYDQTMIENNNDQLLAQTRAREFINFRRRGASDFVGAMVTTIPFFNAYIQGMDVLYRAASGKDSSSSVGRAQARRMFYSRAAIAMTLSSLYALGKGDDDEDYNEMDLRTRDSNWILPGGFKLPVPGELGALFKVIPERIVEYMRRQGTPEEQTAWEATHTALAYIFEQYVGRVVPVPQGVKPLLEAWTNYSFFTGRELEGIYQKQQDPSMRRASNTSELAIAIANFSKDVIGVDKVSPILVDNALSGYFGSSAGLLVAVTDSLLNPTRVDRPLHKYALISNYMYDPVGTRRMTEFYDEREKVGRANTTLRELAKVDMDKAAEYAEKNADKLMLESAVNSTLEQLERTRAYRKYLNSPLAAEDMSMEERETHLKEVKQMEIDFTRWLREAQVAVRQ